MTSVQPVAGVFVEWCRGCRFLRWGFPGPGPGVFRVESFFRVRRRRTRLREIQILSVPIVVRFVNAKYKNVIFASKRIRFFPGRVGGRSRYFGGLFVVISLTQLKQFSGLGHSVFGFSR